MNILDSEEFENLEAVTNSTEVKVSKKYHPRISGAVSQVWSLYNAGKTKKARKLGKKLAKGLIELGVEPFHHVVVKIGNQKRAVGPSNNPDYNYLYTPPPKQAKSGKVSKREINVPEPDWGHAIEEDIKPKKRGKR